MNRKGFTLIEVLAVIILLGIILTFAIPNVLTAYKNSKLKSEDIFAGRLSDVIDDYVKLNIDEVSYDDSTFYASKSHNIVTAEGTTENYEYPVTVYKGTISVQDLISSNLISLGDFVNAGNKEAVCNVDAEIEIYRDSDFVYCHKINKNSLGCLTDTYKSSITGDYVINTCIWEVDS